MNEQHTNNTKSALLLAWALALIAGAGLLLGTSSAYAGNWMEVSCVNPNQSAAPSEGWSSFAAGGGYGSNNSTSCGPGSPMFAILSTDAAVGVGSAETLQYTPPGGSKLIGGSVDVSLYADGGGYNASGTAVAYTPNYAYDGSDVFFQCASGLPPCANGTYDFAGVLGIPGGRGGNLYLSAGCGGHEGYACNSGGSEGAWSLVRLWWANFLLSNEATPSASGVSGTLLSPNASGTQELTFNATDPGGPGVYLVTVQIDGKAVYSGTPNNNGGKCVAVGSSGGALMFDYGQPCPASESVDLPINTSTLPNGQHTLKLVVEDAAGNSAVVYDGTITTKQPSNGSLGALPGPGTGTAKLGSASGPEWDRRKQNGTSASWDTGEDHSELRASQGATHRAPAQRPGPADRRRGSRSAATGQRLADAHSDRAHNDSLRRDVCSDGAGWTHADDRGRLPRVLHRPQLRRAGKGPGVSRRGRAAQRQPAAHELGRHDHTQRSGVRPGPRAGSSGRDACPLSRPLGALPRSAHRLARALSGRLSIPGRRRQVPVPGVGLWGPDRVSLLTWRKQVSRCHHKLTCG